MLQFITHADSPEAIVAQVKDVLAGGCKWVQLRMKRASREEIVEVAKELQPLCKEAEAIFVIDDHVDIAKELGLDGVHLGKNDMDPRKAREELGEEFIIGATANTLEDVLSHNPAIVDYIGLGPFRFTTTKDNLSPVIGTDGYKAIMDAYVAQMKEPLPVVAIGGITFDDIDEVMNAGVNGIAMSGSIIKANDPVAETTKITDKLQEILVNKQNNK